MTEVDNCMTVTQRTIPFLRKYTVKNSEVKAMMFLTYTQIGQQKGRVCVTCACGMERENAQINK